MKTLILALLLPLFALAQTYPESWWREVPRSEAASWEILPQDAAPGEVILSKRTELGVFSNFAPTPIVLDGKRFASLEGMWQSMKYPDPRLPHDPRHAVTGWPYTRSQVEQMVAFEAKEAGDLASQIYKQHGLKSLSWGEHFFEYKDYAAGSQYHYQLIKRATRAKLDQNPGLWELLLKTGCLILKPDHHTSPNDPPAYKYFDIYMELRREKLASCQE